MSFTFVRNPWDRLASAYLSKIERGLEVKDRQALMVQQRVRALFGLKRGAKTSPNTHAQGWVCNDYSVT